MKVMNVTAKLGNMRKPQEFIVYPASYRNDGLVFVQSDKSCGLFDPATGHGRLYTGRGPYANSLHLAAYGKPYQFDPQFMADCLEAQARPGWEIGPGVFVAGGQS